MRTEEEETPLRPSEQTPLQAAIERAAAGDQASFRDLFQRYHDRVYRYAFVRLGRAEDAGDMVQDVFLSVWRALPGFRYEHEGSFPAWLFRIASRRVGDRIRHRIRHEALPLEEAPEVGVEFEGAVVSRRLLLGGLAGLPQRQREVVVLRFVIGLQTREIALSMGTSEAAVTALQMRGLERLRRYMGRDDEAES